MRRSLGICAAIALGLVPVEASAVKRVELGGTAMDTDKVVAHLGKADGHVALMTAFELPGKGWFGVACARAPKRKVQCAVVDTTGAVVDPSLTYQLTSERGSKKPGIIAFRVEIDGVAAAVTTSFQTTRKVHDTMAEAFGADFSGVRVHVDSAAADPAGSMGAQAFAHGVGVVFSTRGADEGRELIAHELTHTVQQATGSAKK